jgi:hypothetical protein
MQTQAQPPNKFTEIAVFTIVALLVLAGVFLLYFGKVDFTGMLTMFGFAGGVLGVNGAFKAPSPAQSAQLQALFSQVMNVLPGLFNQLQPPAVTIHNNIPPTAIGQAPSSQPAPVPPAQNLLAPQNVNATATPAPIVASVPQQPFPPSPFFPAQFGNTTQTPVVPTPQQ